MIAALSPVGKGAGVVFLTVSQAGTTRDRMPRRSRSIQGGFVYHVLNRSIARAEVFSKEDDYAAFERVLEERLGYR